MLHNRAGLLRLLLAAAVLSAPAARAQDASLSAAPTPTFRDEWLEVALRYAVSVHSGTQQDPATDLNYSGWTPNDFALRAHGWFLLGEHLGVGAELHREAFGLFEGTTRVAQGGLFTASVGPTGRIGLGPVRLEALVGYSFSEVPLFAAASPITFGSAQRHSLLASARALVDLGPVRLEGRFGLPVVLATSNSLGLGLGSTALTAGGSVRVQLARVGQAHFGLLADVQWMSDKASTKDSSVLTSQSVVTAGLALDLQLREELVAGPPPPGTLSIKVVAEGDPKGLGGALLHLRLGTEEKDLTCDAKGEAKVSVPAPLTVTARASLAGYEPSEGSQTVAAGGQVALVLTLQKEKPKFGAVVVGVTDKQGKPLAQVKLDVGGVSATTDDTGHARLEQLPPGPAAVKATLAGYLPGSEAVSVVAGSTAQLDLQLMSAKKREPATISGHVRNARGGAPVAATLELPEAQVKLKVSAKGTFSVKVPGGTYTVKITAPGFLAQTKSVTVNDGDQTIFNVDLFPN